MQADKTLISRLEKLARLKLDEKAQTRFAEELSGILILVEKLHEPDTTGIEPLAYPTNQSPVLREDAVSGQLNRRDALRSAPEHNDDFFLVPSVMD